ncbi:hypothetical protein A3K73_04920 [Candidatus Pacearchaeota archaeon RBG_13_36_9]|nr:MAG: hypothetical protein A3K73_04920 [Candidatus Pacearchaeota archaeon RBG_13_36_9]
MQSIRETKSFIGREVIGSVPKFRVPKTAIIGVATKTNENESIRKVRQKDITPRGNKSAKKSMLR